MSANEASLGTFDPGLDDAFEQFGPVDVDAFIDSQFNYALEGQEELQNTDFSKTDVGSRNELQMAASSTSTLHSIEFSLGGTQTNLDKANSFVSSLDELQMSGFSGMCSRCHKIMDKEDVVSYQTRKCETKGELIKLKDTHMFRYGICFCRILIGFVLIYRTGDSNFFPKM